MRSHDRFAHAKDFKTNVLAFAVAVEPKAYGVRAPSCEEQLDVLNRVTEQAGNFCLRGIDGRRRAPLNWPQWIQHWRYS